MSSAQAKITQEGQGIADLGTAGAGHSYLELKAFPVLLPQQGTCVILKSLTYGVCVLMCVSAHVCVLMCVCVHVYVHLLRCSLVHPSLPISILFTMGG